MPSPEIGSVGGAAASMAKSIAGKHADATAPKTISTKGLSGIGLRMAEITNQYGDVIFRRADELGVEPALAAAVLQVESNGRAMSKVEGEDRAIIRFEVHIFRKQFTNDGKNKDRLAKFNKHFQYNAKEQWKDHQWRESEGGSWVTPHASQTAEYKALEFAKTLDRGAAFASISSGMAQIMGFNAAAAGYGSAEEMYNAFNANSSAQVEGFFEFVSNYRSGKAVTALQGKDSKQFALIYNGKGQAEAYGAKIDAAASAFRTTIGDWRPPSENAEVQATPSPGTPGFMGHQTENFAESLSPRLFADDPDRAIARWRLARIKWRDTWDQQVVAEAFEWAAQAESEQASILRGPKFDAWVANKRSGLVAKGAAWRQRLSLEWFAQKRQLAGLRSDFLGKGTLSFGKARAEHDQ